MRESARETLTIKLNVSKEHRIAIAKLQQAKLLKRLNPKNTTLQTRLKTCRVRLRTIEAKADKDECQKFLSNLKKTRPALRMKYIYQYYRKHKLNIRRKQKQHYIPMLHWENELAKSEGPAISELKDEDPSTLGENPTKIIIEGIIRGMRNGTAPGADQVVTELFKAVPERFLAEITAHMDRAWTQNILPTSWTQTIQIPIPKKKHPKTTSDYRRISICNTGYRIYANFLLQRLDERIDELGNYQAAFLRNRSTDDHMFTLRRILDEEWRQGERLYVIALDIEKAFDTVDLNCLRDILVTRTDKALTNRIIKACMNETTCIRWFGQQSKWITKGKGVKQGCPLSPRLFTILMDDVLRTMEEELSFLKLDQDNQLELPIILSFADDVIILSRSLDLTDQIFIKMKSLLQSVGLHINETKTKAIIRDPGFCQPNSIKLDGTTIQLADKIRYLGTNITSGHNRRQTIITRCDQAVSNAKSLAPFIKQSKMEWQTVRLIYKMVIEPTMTYGLKAAALTKAMRSKLRRTERLILSDMISHARTYPHDEKTSEILQGKTISKRVKALRLNYYGHVLRREPPHLLHAALRYKAVKRKPGRPIFTWKDSLKHDMEYYKRTKEEWKNLADDRPKFKSATEEIYNISETDSEAEAIGNDQPSNDQRRNTRSQTTSQGPPNTT